MKTIGHQLKEAFTEAKTKGYDHIVIAVDLHNTIISSDIYNNSIEKGNTKMNAVVESMITEAVSPLRKMSLRKDIQLLLFSGTNNSVLQKIALALQYEFGIEFEHINVYISENPLKIKTQSFKEKPYYSILWDDKAGFEIHDWVKVDIALDNYSINSI